jgi:hypothetical protein
MELKRLRIRSKLQTLLDPNIPFRQSNVGIKKKNEKERKKREKKVGLSSSHQCRLRYWKMWLTYLTQVVYRSHSVW